MKLLSQVGRGMLAALVRSGRCPKRCGQGGAEGEILPPGISEPELLSVCVGPDLDSTTAQACLKELREQCLYLHFDGVRYCFKKDPNVTLLVEQEADVIARDERRVRDRIRELLEARLAGYREAIVWPDRSGDISDKDPSFLIAYLPLEVGAQPKTAKEALAKELFEKFGDRPRQYRNGLGLALPSADQIEVLRRAVRYLVAIEQVREKAKQHNLTDEQKAQLREREATERAAVESAFLKLYTEIWLPRVNGSGITIESIAAGGRPLQTTLNEKKEARVHDRVLELLITVQPRVFPTVTPSKIVDLFKLGEGVSPKLGIRAIEIVDGFYSFLGFTRLTTSAVIRKAIALGIDKNFFGYMAGAVPTLGPDSKYQVAPDKVRFGNVVTEDEIDLETGFLMMPQAIPQTNQGGPILTPPPGGISPTLIPGQPTSAPGPSSTPLPGSTVQNTVDLSFQGDRNQLYTAWNAIANLADMAGKVSVTVHAEMEKGFDKNKLKNGVLEPLKEADLIE